MPLLRTRVPPPLHRLLFTSPPSLTRRPRPPRTMSTSTSTSTSTLDTAPTLRPSRTIGSTRVPALGFGAMGLASHYGAAGPDAARLAALDAACARGCTHWDTADVYGDSEALLGTWFKKTGRRSEIFLATKCGVTGDARRPVNGEPAYVRKCLERSLERLGVDYVDLYYVHRPDPAVPIEVTMRALAALVAAGKIRHIGLSECTPRTIRRAHAVHAVSALQVEYSLFSRDVETNGVLATARELGIAVVAYAPLGRGMLTGRYTSVEQFEAGDVRRAFPRFSADIPRILALVRAVAAVGARHGATPGQVALAWLLAQGDDIIPIPGTRSIARLEENAAAAELHLEADEVAELRRLAEGVVLPARYDAARMSVVMQETPELGA